VCPLPWPPLEELEDELLLDELACPEELLLEELELLWPLDELEVLLLDELE
jgi:hypothetical protein